jgi:hypothetical protein
MPRRTRRALAVTRRPASPSALSTASASRTSAFRGSMAGLCAPTDASDLPSRTNPHGSGSMRLATPSSWWTFTTYSLPVSPAHLTVHFCNRSCNGTIVAGRSPRVGAAKPLAKGVQLLKSTVYNCDMAGIACAAYSYFSAKSEAQLFFQRAGVGVARRIGFSEGP